MRIVCGKGNNGGDGLVAARHLRGDGLRGRGARALGRASRPADLDAWLAGSGAVVDAIFGTGFAGAPREPAAAAIEAINRCGAPVVACDIASGVDASSGEVEGAAVEADLTVSFHAAKLGHRIAPGKWHTGELRVAPIGIPDGRARRAGRRGRSSPPCSAWRRAAAPRSTKFSSGQVAIAGGSRGLTGAVRMSSLAAIRAGAGYATVAVPADLEPVFEAGQPEVMSVGCPGGDGCLAPASAKAAAAGLRARRRRGARARAWAATPARSSWRARSSAAIEAPLVIDADGLNAFAGRARRGSPPARRRRSSPRTRASSAACSSATPRRSPPTGSPCAREAAARGRRGRRAQGRRHDRHRRRAGRGQRALRPRRWRPPAPATSSPGSTAALLARGLEPFAAACAAVLAHARAGRDAAAPGRRRRVGDRHRRDRLDPGGHASRRAGRITSPR